MTTLIPIREFKWTDDFSWLRTLTCANHPTAKYYTKNPYQRSIHFVSAPDGFPMWEECRCPNSDLRVVCEDDGITAVGKPDYAE